MLKKALLGVALLSVSAVASAQMEATAGYSKFDYEQISVGALVAGVGYRIPVSETFSLTPGARVGFGIADDTVLGVDVELDTFYGLVLRAQFDTASGLYLFGLPSYSKAEFSAAGFDAGSSDWEFGIGAGVGFKLSDFVGIEASYETVDDTDVLSLQGRFTF